MTRGLSRKQAISLGMLVLIGIGMSVQGLFWIGSKHASGVPSFLANWLWPNTFVIRSGFKKIHGVEVGTRVRVKGIEAGEVIAVERPAQPSGAIVLVMRLDGKMRDFVRTDASAQIVNEGMVGGKIVEIEPGSDDQEPVADQAEIAARPSADLSDVLAKVEDTIQEVRSSKGTLNKLLHDDQLHTEFVQLAQQGKRTLTSLQQNSDAIKDMPVLRGYVKDMRKTLDRPDCERNRRVFAESELFESGSAVLTAGGRRRLDEVAPWVNGLKHKGSEVVVASFAPAGTDPDSARTLTEKQAESVSTYLTEQHAVHKMGWFSWSRKVTALGCGLEPPPVPEKEKLPPARVEVIVFVPHS